MPRKRVVYLVGTNTRQHCLKDVSDHLNGCYKTTCTGVEAEWRVGLFDDAGDLPPSRFPWETAHDYVLSMIVKTHAPVWPQNYHPLSLTMHNAINSHLLSTCSNSFIPFDLAYDRESFSAKSSSKIGIGSRFPKVTKRSWNCGKLNLEFGF